jgi:hypothetical protein
VSDAPDWQRIVKTVPATGTMSDAPDWERVVVGPGGAPVGGGSVSLDYYDNGTASPYTLSAFTVSPGNSAGLGWFNGRANKINVVTWATILTFSAVGRYVLNVLVDPNILNTTAYSTGQARIDYVVPAGGGGETGYPVAVTTLLKSQSTAPQFGVELTNDASSAGDVTANYYYSASPSSSPLLWVIAF